MKFAPLFTLGASLVMAVPALAGRGVAPDGVGCCSPTAPVTSAATGRVAVAGMPG